MEAGAGETQAGPGPGASAAEVDLSPELCAEIQALAGQLESLDCYQVLGLARGADADGVRAAFFERSRRFHPDRYFNKRLGSYQPLLHEIYKRVVAANEVLRDPELRKVYDASLPREGAAGANRRLLHDTGLSRPQLPGAPPPPPPPRKEPEAGKPRAAGPSLRDRSGLRAPNAGLEGLVRQLEANREKGLRQFEEAEARAARGDWEGAVQAARLALAFAPRDPQLHAGLAEWLPRVQQGRSERLLGRAESLLLRGEEADGLDSLVGAFRVLPIDPALARRAAALAVRLGNRLPLALELAECAVALDEDNTDGRKLLGLICVAAGRTEQARIHLQRVWKAHPHDADVKRALASL